METLMKKLTLLSAVAAMTLVFASSSSYAQGWGPCTQPGNSAVGADGPAMNGGQLMAGVGQCRRIGRRARNSDAYDYYGGPVDGSWGRPYGYRDGGYRDAPTVWGEPVYRPY
jgi:hypothetical protein